MPTLIAHRVHIELPVIINDNTVPSLAPSEIRSTLKSGPICIAIIGEGGSGKTSLAATLG